MDQEALHILLLIGFHRSNREISHYIKQEGLMPGQPKILEYLWTSLLKRMEKLELIRKEPRPDDQRGVSIFMTEKGREKAKRIREIIYGLDDFMWQGIEPEERQRFMETFRKIIKNQKKWGD